MTAAFDQFPHERRRSPRVSGAGIKVEYTTDAGGPKAVATDAKNICIHGICIFMPAIGEKWKTVRMNILLPGRNTPVRAVGSVVWYNMLEGDDFYSVGIEFEEISEEDQKLIDAYVKTKLEE